MEDLWGPIATAAAGVLGLVMIWGVRKITKLVEKTPPKWDDAAWDAIKKKAMEAFSDDRPSPPSSN